MISTPFQALKHPQEKGTEPKQKAGWHLLGTRGKLEGVVRFFSLAAGRGDGGNDGNLCTGPGQRVLQQPRQLRVPASELDPSFFFWPEILSCGWE